jgi:alpha-D-ribose 1-methylphosphonate 5-triphosphate synthase subunit PhnH
MSNLATAIPTIWQPHTQQNAYRQLMQAFANPGKIETLAEDALLLTLATLLDGATSLADVHGLISELDLARLETVNEPAETAHFVLADGAQASMFTPSLGTLESPEGGATLFLTVTAFNDGTPYTLSGPGVDGARNVTLQGLNSAWLDARESWNAAFPMGVDIVLLVGNQVMALPRTTSIKGA